METFFSLQRSSLGYIPMAAILVHLVCLMYNSAVWITHSLFTTFCQWVCGLLQVFAIVNNAKRTCLLLHMANRFLVIYPGVELLGSNSARSGLENAKLFFKWYMILQFHLQWIGILWLHIFSNSWYDQNF